VKQSSFKKVHGGIVNRQELVLNTLLKVSTEADAVFAEGLMAHKLDPTLIALRILLKGAPDKQDFLDTLVYVYELRHMAAETLLAGELTNHELFLITACSEIHRRTAWEKLLQQNPTNADLMKVIEYSYSDLESNELKKEALEQLIKQSPTQDDLIKIIATRLEFLFVRVLEILRDLADEEGLLRALTLRWGWHSDSLKIGIARRLLEINCSKKGLIKVANITGEAVTSEEQMMSVRAIDMLIEQNASVSELDEVLQVAGQPAKERICKIYMSDEPNDVHYLIRVVEHSEFLRMKAADKLIVAKLDHDQVRWAMVAIAIYYPPLRKKAWKRFLAGQPTTSNLDDLLFMAHKAGADRSFVEQVAGECLKISRPRSHWQGRDDATRFIMQHYPHLKTA
jgi:hypothetical protein